MKRTILSSLLSFVLGSVITYLFVLQNSIPDARQIENTYLIHAVKVLSNTEPSKRIVFITQSPFFSEIEEIKTLSDSNSHYLWFGVSKKSLKSIGFDNVRDANKDFFGFYVVLHNNGSITDFGYHKP